MRVNWRNAATILVVVTLCSAAWTCVYGLGTAVGRAFGG